MSDLTKRYIEINLMHYNYPSAFINQPTRQQLIDLQSTIEDDLFFMDLQGYSENKKENT